MLNVANVQILPISIFNFQWDKVDGKLTIGNIITLVTLSGKFGDPITQLDNCILIGFFYTISSSFHKLRMQCGIFLG